MRQLLSPRRLGQVLVDAGIVALAWWLAFHLRFDHTIPIYYRHLLSQTILIVLAIKLIVFIAFGFYNRWWRYV
jgi:FlaA1/EpsC-like NDP-sugar epimerase